MLRTTIPLDLSQQFALSLTYNSANCSYVYFNYAL